MLTGNSLGLVLNILDDYRFWAVLEMTGPNAPGGGGGGAEREENTTSPPTSAWCTSTSVGSTMFDFTWNIADYQRKKESIKRDDSIQSSTFTIQVTLLCLLPS